VLAAVGTGFYILHRVRNPLTIMGAVTIKDTDSRKELPIADVEVTVASGAAEAPAKTDASGYFVLHLHRWLRRGRPITLKFRHPNYQPLDLEEIAENKLYVAHMVPISKKPDSNAPAVAIGNVRVRYSIKAPRTMNVGSAVKAFEVNAVDYLLKPFDKKRVAQSVQRVRSKLESSAAPGDRLDTLVRMLESQQPHASKLLLKAVGRLFLVDQKDICYASIEDGVITVVTGGLSGMEGQSNCRTLEELLANLDPNLFWRAHRSYLVNINHIKEVVPWFKSSYQLRMDDKKQTEIPVSRSQTRRLRELFKL